MVYCPTRHLFNKSYRYCWDEKVVKGNWYVPEIRDKERPEDIVHIGEVIGTVLLWQYHILQRLCQLFGSLEKRSSHHSDVIISAMASQIIGVWLVCSTVCLSGTDQRKYQSSASLAFVRAIHRWPVDFPHRGPGPCITNVIATCRKNFSQWESSFLWKLRYHWLKFLRRVAKTLVIQGPVTPKVWVNSARHSYK